jgi:hypothetical protein
MDITELLALEMRRAADEGVEVLVPAISGGARGYIEKVRQPGGVECGKRWRG